MGADDEALALTAEAALPLLPADIVKPLIAVFVNKLSDVVTAVVDAGGLADVEFVLFDWPGPSNGVPSCTTAKVGTGEAGAMTLTTLQADPLAVATTVPALGGADAEGEGLQQVT